MIGAIISMKFLGGKTWLQSLIFWAAVLIIGFAIAAANIGILATVCSVLIFILLAHFWYHLSWIWSIVVWAIAWVIDVIIVFIFVILLLSASLPSGIPGAL